MFRTFLYKIVLQCFAYYDTLQVVKCTPTRFDAVASYAGFISQIKNIQVVGQGTLWNVISDWKDRYQVSGPVGCVDLASQLANIVVERSGRIMHIVPVTGKTQKAAFLNGCAPSTKQLRSVLKNVQNLPHQPRPHNTLASHRIRKHFKDAMPAEKIVDLIRASAELRQVKRMRHGTSAFARLFSKGGPETAEQMLARVGSTNREVIRAGRIRLDYVGNIAFRRYLTTLDLDTISIQLYADASPQRRGLELFAASFDLFVGDEISRRFFPFVAATLGLSVEGKLMTLLWQIFLMVNH